MRADAAAPPIHAHRSGGDAIWIANPAGGVVSIEDGHGALHHFSIAAPDLLRRQLGQILDGDGFRLLLSALEQGSDPRAWPATTEAGRMVRAAVGSFAFQLLRECRRRRVRRWWQRGPVWLRRAERIADLERGAAALLGALRPDAPETMWRARFDPYLDHRRRDELLRIAAARLRDELGSDSGGAAPAPKELAAAYWWTVLCEYEVALEWHERDPASAEATEALLRASGNYLRMLKDEPRRRALERFVASFGSSVDHEVERVLRGNRDAVGEDEAVRSTFVAWFTTRYSLDRAVRLVFRTVQKRQLWLAGAALLLSLGAAVLFLLQRAPMSQVVLQLGALSLVVFGAPDIFRILLPRAWLGSLVAWLTIVVSEVIGIFPLTDDAMALPRVQRACHVWLTQSFSGGISGWTQSAGAMWTAIWTGGTFPDAHWFGRASFVAVVLLCAVASLTFMSSELHMRVFRGVVPRTLVCYMVMLFGSLFWGAMLAYPVRYILEKPLPLHGCTCIFGAWILGSFLAVVFGIIVQLIWDDQSVGGGFRESV